MAIEPLAETVVSDEGPLYEVKFCDGMWMMARAADVMADTISDH